MERHRPLRYLGNPDVATPGSRTPAGPTHQAIHKVRQRGPCLCQRQGLPATEKISGLNSQARPLAVYASQAGSPQHHARLASGCGPDSTGRDWLPAGFRRKVSDLLLTSLPPFPNFPDAMTPFTSSDTFHLFDTFHLLTPFHAPFHAPPVYANTCTGRAKPASGNRCTSLRKFCESEEKMFVFAAECLWTGTTRESNAANQIPFIQFVNA